MSRHGPACTCAFWLTFRSNELPMSIFPDLLVLTSMSSQSKTIFFAARTSTSPSDASMRNFLFFTSKVIARFPDLSAMTILSPFLESSSKMIWWPDFVWIIAVVFSSA